MTIDPQTGEIFNPPWQKYIDERDAARADADRLFAHGHCGQDCTFDECVCGWWDACVAHDAEVEKR